MSSKSSRSPGISSPNSARRNIEKFPEARLGSFEANDVTSYAFALVRHNCEGPAETAALVHKIAAFFSNASIRLSLIMAHVDAPEDDARQSA